MKTLATAIVILASIVRVLGEENEGAPRWLFLGDDDALKETYEEAHQVLLVCIYATEHSTSIRCSLPRQGWVSFLHSPKIS
jgi:hypothetical protein